ncbi:MAG TPA: bifunctional transaldolase/phosoglucose isomerase [Polyangiaceae bacterium]|nr:bifunctional transaldolase/phosoglucose isomerase [Polyangiaceae bacterium]
MTSANNSQTNAQRAHTECDQSIWYDNLRRSLLQGGEFARIVKEGVRGCTSNPTIFEKAIGGSTDYDAAFKQLVAQGSTVEEIYDDLVIEDIRTAADLLRPVYDSSNGADGFVSVEVSPLLASDTQGTIAEAKRLSQRIDRPNLMIKIPATPEGLPAVTEVIAAGISVNITLIFSVARYREVALAYIAGLEQAHKSGKDLSRIASVASFFVSRIDSAVDDLIQKKMEAEPQRKDQLAALMGKAAIANAKQAYRVFQEVFALDRFRALKNARAQRVLWASTGTKNPKYPDTLYVDHLMGPQTVNTVPPQTLDAFQDHGTVKATLEQDLPAADQLIDQLAAVGIPLEPVCQKLLQDGVQSFSKSMTSLMQVIASKRAALIEQSPGRDAFALGRSSDAVATALSWLDQNQAGKRLWAKDRSLFTPDSNHDASVSTRLGWLLSPQLMRQNIGRLTEFADQVKQAGFKKALLLGMGGSSLCPEVLATTFGAAPGALELRVLDSTDPEAVHSAAQWAELGSTLFIVASKSGSTIEVSSFASYFWQLCEQRFGDQAGSHFVAISDPGTVLVKLAQEKRYRALFENPADIGGRYSAVSYFGMVPAALLGIDLAAFIGDAEHMIQTCQASVPSAENPGQRLGAFMGGLARTGRDKMTLIASPEVATLGSWIEQLVAESTGKQGKGVVPIDLEPFDPSQQQGADRAFVYLRFGDAKATALDAQVEQLIAAGLPVATLHLTDRKHVGGEFVRWEMATAFASALLGVNPFDEPDVSAAKKATGDFIAQFEKAGALPRDGWVAANDPGVLQTLKKAKKGSDYVVLSAFFARTDERDHQLSALRVQLRQKLGCATTLGYGPRFLHSTGQLHKGGPNTGVFVLLRSDVSTDTAIPGQKFSFGVLRDAQALGDQQVLQQRGRRVVAVNLGSDIKSGLDRLAAEIAKLQ